MKKLLNTLIILAATLFCYSCDVTALVTDIITKDATPNQITYSINYKNEDQENPSYNFMFDEIDTTVYKNIYFDFNNFHSSEGLYSSNGEMGVFFDLTHIEKQTNGDPIPLKDQTCTFSLLTIVKYVDYSEEPKPITKYTINLDKYENINYYNLINNNIISDKNGYFIDTIYCDTKCKKEQLIDTFTTSADNFNSITIINKIIKYKNNKSESFYFTNNDIGFTSQVLKISGIFTKTNINKTFNTDIRIKN